MKDYVFDLNMAVKAHVRASTLRDARGILGGFKGVDIDITSGGVRLASGEAGDGNAPCVEIDGEGFDDDFSDDEVTDEEDDDENFDEEEEDFEEDDEAGSA